MHNYRFREDKNRNLPFIFYKNKGENVNIAYYPHYAQTCTERWKFIYSKNSGVV